MRSKRENPKTGKAHVGGGLRCEERICPAKWIGRVPGSADWWAGAQCNGGEGALGPARPTLRGQPCAARHPSVHFCRKRAQGGLQEGKNRARSWDVRPFRRASQAVTTHSNSVHHCPAVIGRRCWPPPAGVPTNVDSTKGPACLLAQRRRGVHVAYCPYASTYRPFTSDPTSRIRRHQDKTPPPWTASPVEAARPTPSSLVPSPPVRPVQAGSLHIRRMKASVASLGCVARSWGGSNFRGSSSAEGKE